MKHLIDLVMLSYNRWEYTMMTLESLLHTPAGIDWSHVNFVILDNASADGAVDRIRSFMVRNPDVVTKLKVRKRNAGVVGGFEDFRFTLTTGAPFIGKIDNDSIFTHGWLGKMLNALTTCPKLGVVGAQSPGLGHSILDPKGRTAVKRNGMGYFPAKFVGGRFLARREVFGPKRMRGRNKLFGWGDYQKRIKGWKVGWCYPPAIIDHVGDRNFKHPKAIDNVKYRRYMKHVGRLPTCR